MQRENRDLGGLPPELLTALDQHHAGLRVLEIQQMRGRAGYVTVPGERYTFNTAEGTPPKHDEKPDRSTLEIAQTVWHVSRDTRRRIGGDQRFQVRLTVVDAASVTKSIVQRFDVGLEELLDIDDSATAGEVDARSRSTWTQELVRYTGSIHDLTARLGDKYADAFAKMGESQAKLLDKVDHMLGRVVDLVESALQIRADANEAEMRAAVAAASGKSSEDWKAAGKNLLDVVKSPIGIAAAAQLLGMKPEDAAKLMGELGKEEDAGKKQAANDQGYQHSIKEPLEKLVKSLTDPQKAKLLLGLGGTLATLQAAHKSADEATAREKLGDFFDQLGEDGSAKWKVIEDTLDESQRALVMVAMDRLTEAPSTDASRT